MNAKQLPTGAGVLEALEAKLTRPTREDEAGHHPIARLKVLDCRTDLHDLTCRIGAENVRERDRPGRSPAPHIDIQRPVDRDGMDTHQDVMRSVGRDGNLLDPQYVRPAVFVEDDRLHVTNLGDRTSSRQHRRSGSGSAARSRVIAVRPASAGWPHHH
jgi:hypothetical protein